MTESESARARASVHPKPDEALPALLQRVLPPIQASRAAAYNRLIDALRRQAPAKPAPPGPDIPDLAADRPTDYPTVCAHVTEDLKLASEAVIELRSVIDKWPVHGSKLVEKERATLLGWLDQLQNLEERKLVATVSLHAVQRSGQASGRSSDDDNRRNLTKYSRDLNDANTEINDLLQEVREYCLEFQEREEG